MKWTALDSNMFTSVAYDDDKCVLYLRFRTGEVYRYFDVTTKDYQALLDADSHGRHFLANIRDRFRYERLAKLHAA